MEHPDEGAERPAWVSSFAIRGERRVASNECPVSFISGESVAWVELFAARKILGQDEDLHAWPARQVDALLLLSSELERIEGTRNEQSRTR
jgi:hypothetical protein